MGSVINRTTVEYIEDIHIYDYDEADWIRNPDVSELVGGPGQVEQKYWKIDGDNVVEMSQAEKDVVDEAELEEYKTIKIEAIDAKTRELISGGFLWATKYFSLSIQAQMTWVGLDTAVSKGVVTFPYEVTTLDDCKYAIADAAEWVNFYLTGFATVGAIIKGGRDIKSLVPPCTTAAEVDAIVDPR